MRKFSDFGDNQLDYPFLKKVEPVNEHNAVEPGREEQNDFDIPLVEEENNMVQDIINAYAFANRDLYSEAMSWATDGLTPTDVKQHVKEDLNINISLAEAEMVMKELSSAMDNTAITASTRKFIPFKKSCMDSMVRVASDKYKYKYAEVYWQVKSMKWNGEERLCLVRVEE